MRIVQVGAYPPPYGGVTVHLARLHEQLLRRGMESTIIDLSPTAKQAEGVLQMTWPEAAAHLDRLPRSIVHFHNFAPGNASAYRSVARRHTTVLSLHNERFEDELRELGLLRRQVALSRLRRVHCVVVDSERCREMARRLWGASTDIRLIPEFIPPTTIPPLEHEGIRRLRERCRFLLASNAWRLTFHRGDDLYGLDMLVELMRRLRHDRGLDVGLAFLLPTGGDDAYLARMLDRIRDTELDPWFEIVTEPIEESSSLWREADVVVRATNTDGNSMTVLEALSVGVPVVASDCVERPQGSLLFRTRDQDDLTERVADVLADLDHHVARVRDVPAAGSTDRFLSLYDSLREKWKVA